MIRKYRLDVRPLCRIITTICLISLNNFSLSSQRVQHFTMENGLCTNSLTDLTCDHKGNMWIGSVSGLMKFSGTHFKCITKAGNGSHEISGLEMHSVAEDHCGNIWIGTTAGLDKINPITFEVTQYPIKSPYPGITSVGYIYSVYADKYDFIWFSTDIAIFRMDAITGIYEAIPVNKDKWSVPQHHVIYNGFLDVGDGLWISTGGGIAYFDYESGTYYHRYHNPERKVIFDITQGLIHMQSDLELDNKGRFWFVLENKYLVSYQLKTEVLDTFRLNFPFGTWPCCWSIAVDEKDNIWIGSRHGGVQVFNPVTKSFISLKSEGINRMIQSDYIYSIERGSNGQMFVAHDNGLDVINLYDLSLREIKLSSKSEFLNLKFQASEISVDDGEEAVYIPFYNAGFFKCDFAGDSIEFIRIPGSLSGSQYVYVRNDSTYLGYSGNLVELVNNHITKRKLLPDSLANKPGEVIWYYEQSPESIYFKKNSGKIYHLFHDDIEVMDSYGFKPNVCLSVDSLYFKLFNAGS